MPDLLPSLPYALAFGLALLFGVIYAVLLNGSLRWLADDATELSVIIGVGATLLIAVIVLPLSVVVTAFFLFAASGFPLVLRSAYNRRPQLKENVKTGAREQLARLRTWADGANDGNE